MSLLVLYVACSSTGLVPMSSQKPGPGRPSKAATEQRKKKKKQRKPKCNLSSMKYSCSRQQDLHQRQHRHRLLVVPRLSLVRSPSAVWFVLCTRPFVLICCSLCRDGVLGTLRKRSQYEWYAATSTRCRRFSKQYVHLLLHSYLLTSVKCNSFLCVGRDLNCMTLRGSGEFGPAALSPGLGLQQAPANSRSSSRQSRHSGSGACIRAYLPQLACIFGLFFSSPSFCVITGGASSRDGGASTCSCSIDVKRSWACFRGLLNFWGIHFSLFV